jgi:hypothetical protein
MKSLLNLVGTTFKRHSKEVVSLLSDGTPLLLMPEPDNPHDNNAILVLLPLGYVKKEQAALLAAKLNRDCITAYDAKFIRGHGSYAEIEIEEPEAEDQGPDTLGARK